MSSPKPPRNVMTFKFDQAEQISSDGYLTPVYFNRQVLIRYLYDSRLYCDFASDTCGTIGDDSFSISFGINKNGSVLMWVGDIMHNIPQREQFYLLVENVDPEGDANSDFYEAQVNAGFTQPPLEIKTLNTVEKLNSAFESKFSCFLYKERSIEERIDEARRYKRILMNDADDFKRFITELNEIINESTNNTALRTLLTSNGVDFKKCSKGNKLLEKIYTSVLGDTNNLIAPFFFLYDLRLWAAHTGKDDVLVDVTNKLGLPSDSEFKLILEALLTSILQSSERLMELINA
jgi:hypothetical protein